MIPLNPLPIALHGDPTASPVSLDKLCAKRPALVAVSLRRFVVAATKTSSPNDSRGWPDSLEFVIALAQCGVSHVHTG